MKYKYIVKNWGSKGTQKTYNRKIDSWILNFNNDNKELILFLLEKFVYYDEKKIKKRVKELFEIYKENNPNYENETVFIRPLKEYGVSYSSFMFNYFWFVNNLHDNCEENICKLLTNKVFPEVICIVDDYAGSGKTIIDTLKILFSLDDSFKVKKYNILCIHITEKAENKIKIFANESRRDIKIYNIDKTRKVFEKGNYFNNKNMQEKKNEYLNICNSFEIKYKLGYSNTQSLVSFYYNTPNNTLGLFWNEINGDHLFNRHKSKNNALSELRNRTKTTKEINKTMKVKDVNIKCEDIFALYCSVHTRDFCFEDFCETFGLTETQAHEYIDILIDKELIFIKEGKVLVSDKVKKYKGFKEVFKNENSVVSFDNSNYIPRDFNI